MVLRFTDLSSGSRRQLFRQYATARLPSGLSAGALIEEARSFGLSIRRIDALAVVRELTGRVLSKQTMKFVREDTIPSMRLYAATELNLAKRFQTVFDIFGRNILTGEGEIRRVSFISDERLTMGEMKAQLLEHARTEYGVREGIDFDAIIPVEGLTRATPPFIEEA